MKYKSVIFDWDGTLGMTLHIWLEGYRTELKKLGHDYPDEVIVGDFFYEHNKTMAKYPHIDFDQYIGNVRRYMEENVPHMKLYEGAHETLETLLKNNIKLTAVSSSPRRVLEKALAVNDLTKYFSAISGFDDIMKHKPDPEPFLNMIEIAKLNSKETIIIGDSYTDIVATKAAGLDSCLFLPVENKIFYDFDNLKAANPTYCVESLKNFADLVIG